MKKTVSMLHLTTVLLAAGAFSAAVPAVAALLKTDAPASKVSASFKQMGVAVESPFKKFTAAIDYDAAKPAAATAKVEIDVASLDLGMPEMNQEVAKKEWFNAPQFPKATFISTAIKPGTAANTLAVAGKLSIKGKTQDVNFTVTVKKDGAKQVFDGALPIKRLAFNIGEGEWKATDTVADDVTVKFHVVTTP